MRTKPLMTVMIGYCIAVLALAMIGGIGAAPTAYAEGGDPTPPNPPPADSGFQAVTPDDPAEVDKTASGDGKQDVSFWLVMELALRAVM